MCAGLLQRYSHQIAFDGKNAGRTIDTEFMTDNQFKNLGYSVDDALPVKETLYPSCGMEDVIKDLYHEE